MSLLELPLEIFRLIMKEAVVLRGLKRALRLRVVCKLFNIEAFNAIYESHMLDNCRRSSETCPLYGSYLKHRLLENQTDTFPLLNVIRKLATALSVEDSSSKSSTTSNNYYISQLCTLLSLRSDYQLRQYFQKTQRPNEHEEFDFDLLVAAAYTNKLVIIKSLVTKGYGAVERPSQLLGSSIYAAVKAGHKEILAYLLKNEPNYMVTVYPTLCLAARLGQVETVRYLLKAHWGPWWFDDKSNYVDRTIRACITTPSLEIFNMGMALTSSTLPPISPLELFFLIRGAAQHGWTEMVRHFLSIGVPPNAPADRLSETDNPLWFACTGGHMDIATMLLDHGVQPNAHQLLAASSSGHAGIVRMLLDRGVRMQYTVSAAVKRGHLETLKVLLEYGMDVNEGDQPPVVSAIVREDTAAFCLLVEKGTIINTWWTGTEAMKRAKNAGLESMVLLLKKHGVAEPVCF